MKSALPLSLFVIMWPRYFQEHSALIELPFIFTEMHGFILNLWGLKHSKTVLLWLDFGQLSIENMK